MFRRQTTICREGWYYLAILALVFSGAILKEVNLLLIFAGMLLGPLLLNWRIVGTNLRGLRVDRKLPMRLGAGDQLSVELLLTNPRPRLSAWAVVVEDQIQREAGPGGDPRHCQTPLHPSVLFSYVHAGDSRKAAYRGRLVDRGRYRLGPMRLFTRFPFGLFSKTISLGSVETLTVLPRLGRLTEGWAARRQEAFAGADRRRRRPGPEGDFFGIREWRNGDGQRLIHWRSSARLGKLAVRQFERPRSRDVAVVLDLWQPKSPESRHLENVELAVSFAATVLTDLCRKGGSNIALGLHNSAPECYRGPASPATLQRFMEQLAALEARSDNGLPALLDAALRQLSAGAEIVLVGTRPVDLTDMERFEALWSDPVLREHLRRIRCVDASSEQLSQYFVAE
jgi:uncharacterized protein (DUF58 family)